MTARRVLILSNQPLFAEGVRSLLTANDSLQVIGVEKYCESTLARVRELTPDIVILGDDKDMPPQLLTELLDVPELRVVRVTLEGNVIHLYNGHQIVAHQAQDFVNLLNGLTPPMTVAEHHAVLAENPMERKAA